MDNEEEQIQKLRVRVAKIQEWMKIAEKRIQDIESAIIERDASFSALLTCVREFGKIDKAKFHKLFEAYAEEYHQKLLEKIEDQNPFRAATLDRRNPEKE